MGRERTEERKRLETIFLDGKEVKNFQNIARPLSYEGIKQLKVPQVANVQLETLGSVERHKVSVRKVIHVFV